MASAQLTLESSKTLPLCRCGHEVAQHSKVVPKKRAKACERCDCEKYKVRGRPPPPKPIGEFAPPLGSVEIVRGDTVRRKAMGWALFLSPSSLVFYLDHLRLRSPNENRHFFGGVQTPEMQRKMFAARAKRDQTERDRSAWAITQLDKADALVGRRPSQIVVVRVMSGSGLDDDNLAGACKHVRDGIADALGFNDREFSSTHVHDADCAFRLFSGCPIPVRYLNAKPGKRGVFGVKIEITWPVNL